MKKRAFTLVEIICVLAIIAILAALVQPAFAQAKHRALVQSSAGRLRQLHIAVELYRTSDDLTGYSVNDFPTYSYVYTSFMGFGEDFFKSPCGYKPGIEHNISQLAYGYTPFPAPAAEAHFDFYQEHSVLFRDPHCMTTIEFQSKFRTKRKLSVLAGGRLVNEMSSGNPMEIDWWLPNNVTRRSH